MNKKPARRIPLFTTGIVPSAAVTSALLAPTALGAPGDLDPAFGDVGRLGPILEGPAWSIEPLDDGGMLIAGGGMEYFYYYYWGYYSYGPFTTNFVSRLSSAGTSDPNFTAAALEDIQVYDVARQTDGQVVAVGRRMGNTGTESQLVAFRLAADGTLDSTFGSQGIVALSETDHGKRHMATSVLLEPDGRIVVAGSRDDEVLVTRLLPDGSFDDAFGTSGIFLGPATFDHSGQYAGARTSLVRTADGGYRVTASNLSGCQVSALTATGTTDAAFGDSGIATFNAPPGTLPYCNSMATQSDGRLVIAGNTADKGFAARLLADGQPDPGFDASAAMNAFDTATAVAVDQDGSVVVAGTGVSGATIIRLQASGELDALFGDAGSTVIDLRSDWGTSPSVNDMVVHDDGSVVAVGGEDYSNQAFVVKLLGDTGGDSPGVLGIHTEGYLTTNEGSQEAIVNVRRTGGSDGSVSLAYETGPSDWIPATEGRDYTRVEGRLTWSDGDRSEQQIRVPILSDDSTEDAESFTVQLSDIQGGAGQGARFVEVWIEPDGAPHGQLAFAEPNYRGIEGRTAYVLLARNYYASGEVSVTVTPVSGTAIAGQDFVADPVTVSWSDLDWGYKAVEIPIIDDTNEEPGESFTVQLSNPTGGALIGAMSSAPVFISPSDSRPKQTPSGGSGALGYLSLLLLGVMAALRALGARFTGRRSPA